MAPLPLTISAFGQDWFFVFFFVFFSFPLIVTNGYFGHACADLDDPGKVIDCYRTLAESHLTKVQMTPGSCVTSDRSGQKLAGSNL